MDNDCEAKDFSSRLVWTSSWGRSCSGYISPVLNLDRVLGTWEKPLQQPRVGLRHISANNFCKALVTEVIQTAGLPASTLIGFSGWRDFFLYYLRCGCVAGWSTTTHSMHNVDKPVVGRLTAWCAIPWLAVHFVMLGANLLLRERSHKKQAHLKNLHNIGTRRKEGRRKGNLQIC